MERPPPTFGGSAYPPAMKPFTTVTPHFEEFEHESYSPPAISLIQHQAMFPSVDPFPPPSVGNPRGNFSLMRQPPSILPSPAGTYRLSHPHTNHPGGPQSSVTWVTQSQTPTIYPLPPPCGPHLPHSTPPAAPTFSHLNPAPEFVSSSPGCHGPFPYAHAAIHGMQSPMQQTRQEMSYFDPGFVAAETPQQLSHTVATLQYPPQVPSYSSQYTGTRIMAHSHQQLMQGTVAGHAMEGPQIARPIPVYSHPAPGFGAVSSLRRSTSSPAATGTVHHQVQPQMQFSMEGSMIKGAVSVPMQMPYIVCEESESATDCPQMQVAPLEAAYNQNVEDGALLQASTIEIPSEAQKWNEIDQLKAFAAAFKAYRLKMGYSQLDVFQQLMIRYGAVIRIDDFEELKLTIESMRISKPKLKQWMWDTAKACGTSEELKQLFVSPSTSINPRKEKRQKKESQLASATTAVALRSSSGIVDTPGTIKIPSPSHDITVEVSGIEDHERSGQTTVYIT